MENERKLKKGAGRAVIDVVTYHKSKITNLTNDNAHLLESRVKIQICMALAWMFSTRMSITILASTNSYWICYGCHCLPVQMRRWASTSFIYISGHNLHVSATFTSGPTIEADLSKMTIDSSTLAIILKCPSGPIVPQTLNSTSVIEPILSNKIVENLVNLFMRWKMKFQQKEENINVNGC